MRRRYPQWQLSTINRSIKTLVLSSRRTTKWIWTSLKVKNLWSCPSHQIPPLEIEYRRAIQLLKLLEIFQISQINFLNHFKDLFPQDKSDNWYLKSREEPLSTSFKRERVFRIVDIQQDSFKLLFDQAARKYFILTKWLIFELNKIRKKSMRVPVYRKR